MKACHVSAGSHSGLSGSGSDAGLPGLGFGGGGTSAAAFCREAVKGSGVRVAVAVSASDGDGGAHTDVSADVFLLDGSTDVLGAKLWHFAPPFLALCLVSGWHFA